MPTHHAGQPVDPEALARTGMTADEFADTGISHLRVLPTGEVAGLKRFLFTHAIIAGITPTGYSRRYCFQEYSEALGSLLQWSGDGDPPGKYVNKSAGSK